jgi:hypothetical protein
MESLRFSRSNTNYQRFNLLNIGDISRSAWLKYLTGVPNLPVPNLPAKDDKLSLWLKAQSSRAHRCKVIVALANKLARIAWAVLASGKPYQAQTV